MKYFKFFIGLLLAPLVFAQLGTLKDLILIWAPTSEWRSLWFGSFCGGFTLLLILFFTLPKALWIYVLGHELTHAWAVYLSGGKVYDFKVTSTGGHIKADVVNWFVALSPYFVPLYSMLWMMLWISIDFYTPLSPYLWFFYLGLGFTWAFHICFTIQMIFHGQSDLSSQGTFFSLIIILAVNLLFIFIALVMISPSLQFSKTLHILGSHVISSYQTTFQTIISSLHQLFQWISQKI